MDSTFEAWDLSMPYQLIKLVKIEIKNFIITAAIALVLALTFSAISFGEGFVANTIICLSIGMNMYFSVIAVFYVFKPTNQIIRMVAAVCSLGTGLTIGLFLGLLLVGKDISPFLSTRADILVETIVLGTITGFLYWYIVNSQRSMSITIAKVQKEKIKRLTIEKQVVEANLKLLQAQIEPHFLFNTLSNIITLLEVDTAKGQNMLEHLTTYLRMTLTQSRAETSTLGQEIKMMESYLNIFKIRMGDRLNFTIMIPEILRDLPFPPMLLQPVVENSIIHGIEPKVEGGDIWVKGEIKDKYLRLEIADSGLSLDNNKDWGVGLSNIKERLDALYDNQAKLMFKTDKWEGLAVIIEVPV